MYDYVIVGAGFAGCVLAQKLSAKSNKKVLIIEKRNHIGGNCFDYYNEHGILIHKYGPHIFHTNYKEVWDYLSTFTEWIFYQHKVYSYVGGNLYPMPISLNTINRFFNMNLSSFEIDSFLKSISLSTPNVTNSKDVITSQIGNKLYDAFYKNYTYKQWEIWSEDLEPEVTQRVCARLDNDSRYFKDRYQGIPKFGYTKIFENLLDSKNIHLLLKTDYKDVIDNIEYKQLILSSPIDYHFEYKYGQLPYRSIRFDFKTLDQEYYQSSSVINYPNDYDFTRITEYKYFTGQKHPMTCISLEHPTSQGDPSYPIPQKENQALYKKYNKLLQDNKNTIFIGRLGLYKYLNMDQIIYNSLSVSNSI